MKESRSLRQDLPYRSGSNDDSDIRKPQNSYINGARALAHLPMLQRERDRRTGLKTAGFISGYRGSPLGALDQHLWKSQDALKANDIVFQSGVNEDLAATAVWGSQQTNLWPGATAEGVFGMWYGKGPGVDRTGDVFKHANSAGTDARGGVLVLAGDDHAAKSSSVAHQSEHVFVAAGIPILYPSNVQEYLDYGLHGWAMSRYAGLWIAMKCVTDVVESSAVVDLDPHRVQVKTPHDFAMPPDGLGIRWPDPPVAQETRLVDHKWDAALSYARANQLNRIVLDSPHAQIGILTAGKAYLDVRQALTDLGLDELECAKAGIRIIKFGCIWPLDKQETRTLTAGLKEVLVVEEKRPFLELALKEHLFDLPDHLRPRVSGKSLAPRDPRNETSSPSGESLLPSDYELSPDVIAQAIARVLSTTPILPIVRERMESRLALVDSKARGTASVSTGNERKPWFCSGCPHNTSTRVPDGSRAMAGIGCHYMAMWMDRKTETFSQMGGEGVAWIGQMHFTKHQHMFVNLGDGTYFHSGTLAIRAATAASANVTYKVLFNDAVAMTGGQPVEGSLTVPKVASQMIAEGVRRVVVVTDEPQKYEEKGILPKGVDVYHRRELDAVQRALRETQGTTVLIYDQTCATELRRRRKGGTYPDSAARAFINDAVCEGCGDCSAQSNCLSVEPLETSLGIKRKINQSSCNRDLSCIDGFCPSFVTAKGAQLRKPKATQGNQLPDFSSLKEPRPLSLAAPYGILVTGIGGTGVVTIGALLGSAAHLEGKGVIVLDMAGLAQKGGAVLSHVQIAPRQEDLHATRIPTAEAKLIIGCDALVSVSKEVLSKARLGMTKAAINSSPTPTADLLSNPSWEFPKAHTEAELVARIGDNCEFLDANALALALVGDSIFSNQLLMGYAWQKGWIPLSLASLRQAIDANGVAVSKNLLAFDWGRYIAEHGASAANSTAKVPSAVKNISVRLPESLDSLLSSREALLAEYQSVAYARRYRTLVEQVRAAEARLANGTKFPLTKAVARNLAKLMTYKDEYEVARLYADPAFEEKLRFQFEGKPGKDYRLTFHLAPPIFGRRDAKGRILKMQFGSWMLGMFRVLTHLKFLRGTPFDIFGKSSERKAERRLITDYVAMLDTFCKTLTPENLRFAIKLATLPDEVRGFGRVKEQTINATEAKRHALLLSYSSADEEAGRQDTSIREAV